MDLRWDSIASAAGAALLQNDKPKQIYTNLLPAEQIKQREKHHRADDENTKNCPEYFKSRFFYCPHEKTRHHIKKENVEVCNSGYFYFIWLVSLE